MKKKTTFRGYPRLCLCLMFAVLLTACKVRQPNTAQVVTIKNYELTVALNPGISEPEMRAAIEGLVFGAPEHREAVFLNSVQQPDVWVYKLRAHDRALIDNLVANLEKSGVRIIFLGAK